ncbi:MAG: alpha/beta hydrolase [Actinomycetota bacterium]|nr:alpha/beta hydrolase [Actinomycetota bacterium]
MPHLPSSREVSLATGVRLHYASTGAMSATPVLLLHAWGESLHSFDRLIPMLPRSILAIAVDQRGHGKADKVTTGYSLESLAQDIVAFLDAIDVSSAVLLGSSSGGYVAQQVAVERPDRVAGLVLVGSPRSLRGRPAFADEVDQLTDPVDPAWVRKSLAWFPLENAVPQWYVDDRVKDGAQIPASVWRRSLYGLLGSRPPTETGTITAPTLITWGARDQVLTFADEEELASAIPTAQLIVYEGTGHLVLWERPERVASDLTRFVAALGR